MSETSDFDVAERVNNVRIKLAEAISDLRPLPTMGEIHSRVVSVAADLREIERDLLLVAHVSDLDQNGFHQDLDEIAQQIDAGWEPPAAPVDEVVDRLRSALS